MKVKVFINGRFLGRRQTGVDRFALEVTRAIDRMYIEGSSLVDDLEFQILVPSSFDHADSFIRIPVVKTGEKAGAFWEQFELPAVTKEGILINLCNSAPLLSRNQLVVIHDAATAKVPDSYSRLFRAWYRVLIPRIYRNSAAVCTVSEFSRDELASLYGPRNDIRVLSESAEHFGRVESDARILERHHLRRGRYVLAVSSLSPHKNFKIIVEASGLLKDMDADIVIAGGGNARIFSDVSFSQSDRIKYVGFVSDEELKCLYENAGCFVFPSIYEGYGLPPVEAMFCGCPVISSRAAPMPEVCGDAALYFDPHDAQDLASAIRSVVLDEAVAEQMRAKGLRQSAMLRWSDTAHALVEEIRKRR